MNRILLLAVRAAAGNLPHTRGDEPGDQHPGDNHPCHLPHTRGDEPKILTRCAPAVIICPTRVGMNRAKRRQGMLCQAHLPHTRGDEPTPLALSATDPFHLPHTRGDEPAYDSASVEACGICPTRVGMNRKMVLRNWLALLNLPHTRGDEPLRCFI